jgi:hypothetical protein
MYTSDVGNTMSKRLFSMHINAEGYSYCFYDTLGCVWRQKEDRLHVPLSLK